MKKIIYILIIGLLPTTHLLSQCCPYLNDFEILPANPTSNDTLYLISDVTTPNLGWYLGHELMSNDTAIVVEACFYWTPATALQDFRDTINLGVKEPGIYNLQYIAYQSDSSSVCYPIGGNSHAFDFEVTVIDPIFPAYESFDINYYPNPVVDKVDIVSHQMIDRIELFDSQGKLVLSEYKVDKLQHTIDLTNMPSGMYFLRLRNKNNEKRIEKLIK